MAVKQLPDAETIRQLLDYNPETGVLHWKPRDISHFRDVNGRTAGNCMSVWNAKYAGTQAGAANKYILLKVLGRGYQAHRIIWKLVTGDEPVGEIDHMNRDKHDNRWSNLRCVSRSENMKNKGLTALNTSGEKHISWSKALNRWIVQFAVPGKGQRQVAWEKTMEAAIIARNRLMPQYGYNMELDVA